ncbi:MAG: hypothetical protein IJ749_06170 [Eubacterium sp.]|nr:hypothetical protein [Eubacterium sp.]
MILAALLCLLGVFLGGKVSFAAFKYTPLEAEVHFKCLDVEGLDTANYEIVIEPKDATTPVPDEDRLTVNESGEGIFKMTITEPGTYEYLLYQVEDTQDRVKYDDSKYNVQVFVTTDDNKQLIYSVAASYADSGDKPSEIAFQNEYIAEEETTEETTEATTEESKEEPAPRETEVKKGEKSDKPTADSAKTGDGFSGSFVVLLILVSVLGMISVTYIKIRERRD